MTNLTYLTHLTSLFKFESVIKAAFIARSTLNTVPGGDTIQVQQTAKWLRRLGVQVDILQSNARVEYSDYDLFHFFNLNRPADILPHIKKISKPLFISPIMVDYSEYDRYHRHGLPGSIMRRLSPGSNEYLKTISRWIRGKDNLPGINYIWKGHRKTILEILDSCTAILPNSKMELDRVEELFNIKKPFAIIPNGIDREIFNSTGEEKRLNNLVICVARIEGIKNQVNLIKALNNTNYKLFLIGAAAPNQQAYYKMCKKIAASNIEFKGQLSQQDLVEYYKIAKVHVLPSWFETCGLSSLEAAAMGCNIVITDRGFTKEYYGDDGVYCDPADPESIRRAIDEASVKETNKEFQNKILANYTWEKAALKTVEIYKKYI